MTSQGAGDVPKDLLPEPGTDELVIGNSVVTDPHPEHKVEERSPVLQVTTSDLHVLHNMCLCELACECRQTHTHTNPCNAKLVVWACAYTHVCRNPQLYFHFASNEY